MSEMDLTLRVAMALQASLLAPEDSAHGCRANGPCDGRDMIVYGHISLTALADAAIDAINQYIEEENARLLRVIGEAAKRPLPQSAIDAFRRARKWTTPPRVSDGSRNGRDP